MCGDMNTISKDLGKDGDPENISEGTVGRKIAERLLMEMYCHIDGSDIFRESPNTNVVSSIITISYATLKLFYLLKYIILCCSFQSIIHALFML